MACCLNCFKQYVFFQSHTRNKSCSYVSMRILHQDNLTSGFVSVTIWCFWVFARRQLLKVHRRFGRYFRSHRKGSRQACGLNEFIDRGMWEINFSEWWSHQSDGWRVVSLMGGKADLREGEILWSMEDWYTFRSTAVYFLWADHRKFSFAPCNMHRGETMKSCICQFSYVYNLRND